MMKKLTVLAVCILAAFSAWSAPDAHVFSTLNLDHKGLEKVKAAVAAGDTDLAANELLKYYRTRKGVTLTDFDPDKVKLTADDKKMADESLEHKFFSHYGYQPSYFYGEDIDWTYWPVKDNELRWQLHRHKWFLPLAKAYKVTGDEKYAKAWIEHYTDWMNKNPLDYSLFRKSMNSATEEQKPVIENMSFAWRPLETSDRLQNQLPTFSIMINSPAFTAEFLTRFLDVYQMHAEHIMQNFSAKGNHLLFEAQRVAFAGIYFPEFKNARTWLDKGVQILNDQMKVQVYPDGMQFELDFGYHMASIDIFLKALQMASANGFRDAFPDSYIATIEKMIEVVWNVTYPDGTQPLFSDHKLTNKEEMVRKFKTWEKVFPENQQIRWFASEGMRGKKPDYLSHAFENSGFYVLRDSWTEPATIMVYKAGPPAEWHNQPDNGTFELWRNGRNFFPDSGFYVYGGDAKVEEQRAWHKQTKVHNTLTLDDRNIEKTDSKLIFWGRQGNADVLSTVNPSYEGLDHTRTVFFVDNDIFIIVDRAHGAARGDVALHYGLCISAPKVDMTAHTLETTFKDGNNVRMQVFASQPCVMESQQGWYASAYRSREERPAFAFRCDKKGDAPVDFITVIVPVDAQDKYAGKISASFVPSKGEPDAVKVTIGKRKYSFTLPVAQ